MKLINRIRDMLGIQRTNTRSDAEVDELIRKSIEKTSRDQRERAGRRRHHRRGTRMFAMVLAAALPLSAITSEPLTAYADDSFDSFMEKDILRAQECKYTSFRSIILNISSTISKHNHQFSVSIPISCCPTFIVWVPLYI